MEENIQALLNQIWETNESDDLLISKLYKMSFDEHLTKDQILFLCSRLINSDSNLFKYLDSKCQNTKSAPFRGKLIDFLKEFVIYYLSYCVDYLEHIKRMSIGIYTLETSLIVKGKMLNFIGKVIESNKSELIENVFKPQKYIESLLNEIRNNKVKPSIKGCIWHVIGILISKFSITLQTYKFEVHQVLYTEFIQYVKKKTVEIKALHGMLKGYMYLLEDPHLKIDQIENLYICLKSLTSPLEDANTFKINILALEVLSMHGKVFTVQLQKDSLDLFEKVFNLCSSKNQELKIAANEAIEKISLHISDCLLEESTIHKDVFNYLLCKIKEVLEQKKASIMTNTAISLVGIFANAIVRFMGEAILKNYLEELIVICDKDIFSSLGKEAYKQAKESYNIEGMGKASKFKPSKSIKYILSIQKQYINLLNSYANIIANLTHISELFVKHFYNVLIIGFSTHAKFYTKYKERLCDAIAGIIINLKNFNLSFIRKTVKNGFFESIRITENMLFKESSEEQSLNISVDFWIMLLTRDKTFTEYTVTKFFDQLMSEIFELLESLDVSYVEKVSDDNNVYYEANNMSDLEIYTRTSKFISEFVIKISNHLRLVRLFSKWTLLSLRSFIKSANEYPRIAITYKVIGSIMHFCEEVKFFESNNTDIDVLNFKIEFHTFNASLMKKIEIFQDELLLEAVELLLSVPATLLIEMYTNENVSTLKDLYKKSFEIGFNDIRYSSLALASMEKFLIASSNTAGSILSDILPIFGDYLQEYEKIKQSLMNQNDVDKNSKIEEYSRIQNSIFDILGKIGGKAHQIVPPSFTYSKNMIVNIINTKKISYQFPLYNKKFNIHFDHLLPKIADMALNSMTKEKKFVSSELLHSLILYIIGKQNEDLTASLIYLIEKILYLACDLEKGISVIFETLLIQMVHWMSKKGALSSNKDVISMLDIIIDCSSSRKNLKLRELSSQCLSEYIKWFIKQHRDFTIKEKSSSIKYLIRKIESNALHPDPFKRLGSALCFEKIIPGIANNIFLADKFLLEISFYLLSIVKSCHSSEELNEFVFDYCMRGMNKIISGVEKNFEILSKENPKRNVFKSVNELMMFLHSILLSNESECGYCASMMYSKLFTVLTSKTMISANLVSFWDENELWPQCHETSIPMLQFSYYITQEKIISFDNFVTKYPQIEADNLISVLEKSITKGVITNNEKISFVYIVEILYQKSISLTKLRNAIRVAHFMLESINSSKQSDKKYFILNTYCGIETSFITANQKYLAYLLEKFPQHYREFELDKFIKEKYLTQIASENEAAITLNTSLFFWLLSSQHISSLLDQSTQNDLCEKILFLLDRFDPRNSATIKHLYIFAINNKFDFASGLLTKNNFYFDMLASHFLYAMSKEEILHKIPKSSLKNFITANCATQNITLIFILLERASEARNAEMISIISEVFLSGTLTKFSDLDNAVNQIKIMTMILASSSYLKGEINSLAVDSATKLISMYIDERSINIIKEILNLLGVIVAISSVNVANFYKIIQSRYFPINTRLLKQNSKEWNDFQLIFDCLLTTFQNVYNFQFLEILFPILREENTEYWTRVKSAIKEYINVLIKKNNSNDVQKAIDVFCDREIDLNIRDNIRFTLMKIFVFKYIKKCGNVKIICDLFISNFNKLKAIIDESETMINAPSATKERKFIMVIERTIIFDFCKRIFDVIDSEMFKGYVHHKIFGEDSKGNEATRFFIGVLHQSVRNRIPHWDQIANGVRFSEYSGEDTKMFINKSENRYYCTAYNCLCSLIKLTQVKLGVFNKFLFEPIKDESDAKKEQLFDLLISSHFKYDFPIETNFYVKTLNPNNKSGSNDKSEDIEMASKDNSNKMLIDNIVSDSFFHNTYGGTIKESLVLSQRNISVDFLSTIKNSYELNSSNDKDSANSPSTFEKDYVNKHPIMKSINVILTHMNKLFPTQPPEMPSYLQLLCNEMNRNDLTMNQKIIFIKIILNKSELFAPYLTKFISFLTKFTIDKNACGKGFNYFLRDIATFILSCSSFELTHTKPNVEMISSYINSLIKLCGDTKNIIFRTNLKIVNDLMKKFRKVAYLKLNTITSMLSFDIKSSVSHIWRITAIQILASAIEYDVPIGDDLLYNEEGIKQGTKFIKSIETNGDVLRLVLSQFNLSRTPLHSATLEFLAKLMHKTFSIQENKNMFNAIYNAVSTLAMSKDDKVSVNAMFRCSLHFSQFLSQKELFNLALQLIKKSSHKERNLVMNSVNNFADYESKKIMSGNCDLNDEVYLSDIYYTLFQCVDAIFVDLSEEFMVNVVGVIDSICSMKKAKFTEGIMKIINKIQANLQSKSLEAKTIYYNFLIKNFELSATYDIELNKFILNAMIINFDREKSKEISSIIINFFTINNGKLIPSEPVKRLIYILSSLTSMTIEYEGKLIQLLAKIILVLIYTSSDYDLLIYEKGLENCVYRDLNVNTTGYYLNRSQPVAPSIAIRNTMDEAYATLVQATMQDDGQSQNFIRATVYDSTMNMSQGNINNNMDIDLPMKGNVQQGQNQLGKEQNIQRSIALTQREINLSQHSSLVNTTANYPSMSTTNKNVNFGRTHGEAFKVPYPVNISKRRNYGMFLSENDISYTPIDSSSSNRIRFVAEGAERLPSKTSNSLNLSEIMVKKWLYRQNTIRKNQVKLLRNYRVGDLPDIQIKNKDILDPLIAVCNDNEDVSCELFIELMVSVYKEAMDLGENQKLEKCIENILLGYQIDNYLVVNCLHRVILDFMKYNNEYIPDLNAIRTSGINSKNYHTSILIFEEYVSNTSSDDPTGSVKKLKKIEAKTSSNEILNANISDITVVEKTKTAWAYLLQFYSKLKITDSQIGLIQNFSAPNISRYYIKEDNDFLMQLTTQITKPSESLNRNVDKANLLKATFGIFPEIEKDVKINCLKIKYNTSIFEENALRDVFEDYALSSCSDLGEWDNIYSYLKKGSSLKSSSLEITKSGIYSSSPFNFDDSSLSNDNFSYYISLFFASKCDFDRAYLFHQKSKTAFYKTWLSLGKYTNADLKHEVIADIQKIYEMGEFLSFIKGTSATNPNLSSSSNENDFMLSNSGIKNAVSLIERYLSRWPNHLYDAPSVYQEVYAARKILYNTFNRHLGNFSNILCDNPVLETFDCRENIEIAKQFYKKNALDLGGIHIKTALNLRLNNEYINGYIVYPVLKNKCRLYEIEAMSVGGIKSEIINKYDKFIQVLGNQIRTNKLPKPTEDRLRVLNVKVYLNIALLNYGTEHFQNNVLSAMGKFDELYGILSKKENFISYSKEDNEKNITKLIRPMVKFCDVIIRNDDYSSLNSAQKSLRDIIIKNYVEYGLMGLIRQDEKLINIIPKLLDILYKNLPMLTNVFSKYALKVNMNYYLKWKNQLMAYVNTPISDLLFPIIDNILKKQPQSLFYTFSTIEKYSEIFQKPVFSQKNEKKYKFI